MNSPISLSVAAFLGITAVGLGAFGAHGLKEQLTERGTAATWDVAVLYHLIHAATSFAAALAINFTAARRARTALQRASLFWFLGTLLFSGSLYALALGGPRWLGPVTPVGGVLFMLGWLWVGLAGRRDPGVPRP